MKVALECKSPLLQKSLEIFLSKHITNKKNSDIVIRDEICLDDERCFFISSDKNADLIKPFSKSQLILSLENKYQALGLKKVDILKKPDAKKPLNFEILEKRIDALTKEYQQNILKAVRAFYEK